MKSAPDIWRNFCGELEAAGQDVLTSGLISSELDAAEGVRYLSRLMRIGLEMHLENANPAFPSFYQASHATAKIGADNPDNYYQNATISGGFSYLISGQRGTVPILSFGTKANRYAVDGSMASTGELDIREVDVMADGRFEIIVSREKPPKGNWLPLSHDSSILIVRQTFFNRNAEEAAIVKIQALDGPDKPEVLSLERLGKGLSSVPAFIKGTSSIFLNWAETFKARNFNSLNPMDQQMFVKAGGDPMIHYLHGWWSLEADEVMEIKTEIPECEGWNFQLNNMWMESLHYRHHSVHMNNGLAEYNPDGSVTINVSSKSFGKNWIDSAGHDCGTMLWRWTGARKFPTPKLKIQKRR